jgi:hypothetical protein
MELSTMGRLSETRRARRKSRKTEDQGIGVDVRGGELLYELARRFDIIVLSNCIYFPKVALMETGGTGVQRDCCITG